MREAQRKEELAQEQEIQNLENEKMALIKKYTTH